jgi:apolipoprotein N-acyltransferase
MVFAIAAVSALVSGGLLLAAFPPVSVDVLGWVCLVPLLAIATGRGFLLGAVMAIVASMFAAWLSVQGYLFKGPPLSGDASWHYTCFFLFGLVLTAIAGIMGELKSFSIWSPLALAAVAVTGESLLLFKLPAHLGLSQYRSEVMLTVASFSGIWGVSFVLWVANIGFALVLNGHLIAESRERRTLTFGAVLIAMLAVVAALTSRSDPGPKEALGGPPRAGRAEVAALQTTSADLAELVEMQQRAGPELALAVWPELSASSYVSKGDTTKLREIASNSNVAPFVTTFSDQARPMPHNAGAAFSTLGESERYFKRKLFGDERLEFEEGTRPVIGKLPLLTVGINICFDSCFPAIMRDTARFSHEAADVIALPCVGPESPYGFIQILHGAFTPFRSAELGIPIVRSDSTAYAMITDQTGQILALGQPGYEGVVTAEIDLQPRWTLHKTIGDWLLWLCWGGVVVAIGKLLIDTRTYRRRGFFNRG